jgi:peptidoglycan/xylan/chitin deacetylase (PgdA/CDA1 family)
VAPERPHPVRQALVAGAIGISVLAAVLFVVRGDSSSGSGDKVYAGLPSVPAGQGRAVGCLKKGAATRTHGFRGRNAVALTFDDGPWQPFTGQILDILQQYHASATFFVVGVHIKGNEALLQRELDNGNEIGNHSFLHHAYPPLQDLEATNAAIQTATGFLPCMFRPPYELVNPKLTANVQKAGMTMVTWDVDTKDFAQQGADLIAQHAINDARPGSIILMHDGGGSRALTVAALPQVIKGLRARGFKLVTVTRLFGSELLRESAPGGAPTNTSAPTTTAPTAPSPTTPTTTTGG